MSLVNGPAFIPSSSPYFDKPSPANQQVGETLFDHTSQFYAWYLSWERTPTDHKETFSLLSTIMQVAKISLAGGLYLDNDGEKEALSKLQDLGDQLINGSFPPHEISETIDSILNSLTDNNPKAKLIAKSTLLEYKMLIHNPIPQPPQLFDDYHQVTEKLIAKVNPLLGDFDAEKLSRELSKFIDAPQDPERTIAALSDLIDRWP